MHQAESLMSPPDDGTSEMRIFVPAGWRAGLCGTGRSAYGKGATPSSGAAMSGRAERRRRTAARFIVDHVISPRRG
jgi:hypothetical protein